jgi:flavin reductase (DIM6/NTAB) family NADH-FMN oxidoreductase RutF
MVVETGDFVLNVPTTDIFEAVDFAGTKSGRDYNKFTECGLTPIPASKVKSPMIKECPVNIECKTRVIVKAGVHDLFLADVQAIHMDESVLNEKGRLDPKKAPLFVYLPTSGDYWKLGDRIERPES